MVTPHAAGVHAPARDPRVLAQIAQNIRRFSAGEPLLNTVDLERGY
jgi:phosphoglycerate dehydrogenase-like enzyme